MRMEQLLKKETAKGFTLIESMVTLFIVTLLILVPAVELTGMKRSVERQQTVTTFVTQFEQAKKIAEISNSSALIRYYPTSRKIVVAQAGTTKLLVRIPANMQVFGLTSALNIGNDGYVAPTTITFTDGSWSRKITIQMMWGELIVA